MLLYALTSTKMRILDGLKERGAAGDFEGVFELLEEAARYKNVKDDGMVKWIREHEKIKELEKSYALADIQVSLIRSERASV